MKPEDRASRVDLSTVASRLLALLFGYYALWNMGPEKYVVVNIRR